jgi:metal-responsive CopG/Arc/MetJ family transcriptional regulator
MKTAISLDGKLLEEANKTAKRMGVSRSRLFSIALEEYIRHRRNRQAIDTLNRVYADEPSEAERDTTSAMKAKFGQVIKDSW